jgi:preprotein translocase subunit Sec63
MVIGSKNNMKKKRNFSDVFSKYKVYDDSHGRGSVDEWSNSFNQRYSQQEAKNIVKENDPYIIMELDRDCTLADLKLRYRKLMMQYHPDRGGDPIKCKMIIAAYTILEMRLS